MEFEAVYLKDDTLDYGDSSVKSGSQSTADSSNVQDVFREPKIFRKDVTSLDTNRVVVQDKIDRNNNSFTLTNHESLVNTENSRMSIDVTISYTYF